MKIFPQPDGPNRIGAHFEERDGVPLHPSPYPSPLGGERGPEGVGVDRVSRHITRRAGFTLVEIMVAIAIFMMLIMVIYSTWALVMKATAVGQGAAARAQRQRIALRTIEDSLMCIQSFQASQRYYYFDVENGDAPVLSFASRLPDVFPRNGKFGDFNLRRVTFSLEAGTGGEKDLVLRQNPILMDMDEDEQKNPLVLAHNVKEFDIECWDTNQMEWATEWLDTNSIPPLIRIGLVLGGEGSGTGKDSSDLTVIRAFSMPSSMMPGVVQRGGPGGPGNPGGPGGGLQVPIVNRRQ